MVPHHIITQVKWMHPIYREVLLSIPQTIHYVVRGAHISPLQVVEALNHGHQHRHTPRL